MADATLAPGTLVDGRYELVAFCAEGAFGQVWRARDTRLHGRAVAVKFLRAELLKRADVVERFENEGRALTLVAHPNVVAALDHGTWEGQRFLVLEWVDGTSLDKWIASFITAGTNPPFATVAAIFDEVCAAVGAAHALSDPGPVIHRDLKPENVMLRTTSTVASPTVKVLDFGIARLHTDARTTGTRTGIQMGTFPYMAPEQATGAMREIGPWTDVFALGVVLFELLAGTPFPVDETAWWTESLRNADGVSALLATRLGPAVPDALQAVMARALRRETGARFPDALALQTAFRAASGLARWSQQPVSVPVPSGPPMAIPPPPRIPTMPATRSPAMLSALAGAGLLVVAGTGAALLRKPPPPPVTPVHLPVNTAVSGHATAAPAAPPCPDGMVLEPGGTFLRGLADADRRPGDAPRASVNVGSFCIDRREVTVRGWHACERAGACVPLPVRVTEDAADTVELRTLFSSLCEGAAGDGFARDTAANCVDATQAEAFCAWRHARLPTEDEWEFAARGTSNRTFPWGAAEPDATRVNACGHECVAGLQRRGHRGALREFGAGDDGAETVAVTGSKPAGATPEGVADLAGNVAEWVRLNPGSDVGTAGIHGVRGGSWFSAHRLALLPAFALRVPGARRNPQTGFRCAGSATGH